MNQETSGSTSSGKGKQPSKLEIFCGEPTPTTPVEVPEFRPGSFAPVFDVNMKNYLFFETAVDFGVFSDNVDGVIRDLQGDDQWDDVEDEFDIPTETVVRANAYATLAARLAGVARVHNPDFDALSSVEGLNAFTRMCSGYGDTRVADQDLRMADPAMDAYRALLYAVGYLKGTIRDPRGDWCLPLNLDDRLPFLNLSARFQRRGHTRWSLSQCYDALINGKPEKAGVPTSSELYEACGLGALDRDYFSVARWLNWSDEGGEPGILARALGVQAIPNSAYALGIPSFSELCQEWDKLWSVHSSVFNRCFLTSKAAGRPTYGSRAQLCYGTSGGWKFLSDHDFRRTADWVCIRWPPCVSWDLKVTGAMKTMKRPKPGNKRLRELISRQFRLQPSESKLSVAT